MLCFANNLISPATFCNTVHHTADLQMGLIDGEGEKHTRKRCSTMFGDGATVPATLRPGEHKIFWDSHSTMSF